MSKVSKNTKLPTEFPNSTPQLASAMSSTESWLVSAKPFMLNEPLQPQIPPSSASGQEPELPRPVATFVPGPFLSCELPDMF